MKSGNGGTCPLPSDCPPRPRAAETLRIHLDRAPDARELVQYTIRWETLVQRLTGDPAVPRDIAGRTVIWRNDDAARCEQDPAVAREAGAFRVWTTSKL